MNLTSPTQVKSWCIENGFHPNKTLGQNFLIDRNTLVAIADAGLEGAAPGETVLEVGPGLGVLTEEMLGRGMRVTAIEKDPVLAERLAREFAGEERFSVVALDALDRRAEEAAWKPFGKAKRLVSNLPYQAGTRILLNFVLEHELDHMTVLLQTEVAQRLAAKEGSKMRSLSGTWAQLDYDVKILRNVAAACFWPRPEIGSTLVKLSKHSRNASLTPKEREMFRFLTKKAFEHRRKQLGSIFKDMVKSTARAESLSNEEWVNLSKGTANENS